MLSSVVIWNFTQCLKSGSNSHSKLQTFSSRVSCQKVHETFTKLVIIFAILSSVTCVESLFRVIFCSKIVNFITCTWKLEVYVKIFYALRKMEKEWENVVLNLKSHERKSINISREREPTMNATYCCDEIMQMNFSLIFHFPLFAECFCCIHRYVKMMMMISNCQWILQRVQHGRVSDMLKGIHSSFYW